MVFCLFILIDIIMGKVVLYKRRLKGQSTAYEHSMSVYSFPNSLLFVNTFTRHI